MTQMSRLSVALIAASVLASTSAPAQSNASSAARPASPVVKLLADLGYVAIPFSWDDGENLYQFVHGKIDTTSVDFALDSGMNFDFALDPSLAELPGVRPLEENSAVASAYGSEGIPSATVDQIKLGRLALGPLNGRLATPIISSAKGMLGVTVFADHAAVFDFATDTLYLLAADTTRRSLPPPPAGRGGTLRTTLEAARQYRTFLALMQDAGLMPLLDPPAHDVTPRDAAVDSLAWDGLTTQAVHLAGLDTMQNGAARERLVHDAMNRQFRPAGQVTVFAPTDAAFARLAPTTLKMLRADRARLAAALRAHLLTSTSLQTSTLRTLMRGASQPAGATLGFHRLGPQLDVDRLSNRGDGRLLARATVIQPDLLATNGVAHGIDRVLIEPADPSPVTTALVREGYVAVPLIRLPGSAYAVRADVSGTTLLLVVDTGAPPALVLDGEAAERLGVSEGDSVSVGLAGGPKFSVGSSVMDLSAINAKMRLRDAPTIDGLLGVEVLTKYHTRYDFGTGTLYLRY